MVLKKIAALLVLLFGCGVPPEGYTLETALGVYVFDDVAQGPMSFTKKDFGAEEGRLWSIIGQKSAEYAQGVEVHVKTEADFHGHWPDANGISFLERNQSYIWDTGCLALSAYAHELYHQVQWKRFGRKDAKHEDVLWAQVDGLLRVCK